MFDFKKAQEEIRRQERRLNTLEQIYDCLEERMKWSTMEFHSADMEHDESWFTDYEPDDDDPCSYNNARIEEKQIYMDVLSAIEKMAKR